MAQLHETEVDPIALLPLIMQIDPTIPVLHEHTGFGLKAVHAKTKWQWVVVGKVVLLSDENLRVYHADPRELFVYTTKE